LAQPEPAPGTEADGDSRPFGSRIVLLAGPDENASVVANYLEGRVRDLVVIVESGPSRARMARRRAKRVGWVNAAGQILFVALVQPLLRRTSRRRRAGIRQAGSVDSHPRDPDYSVSSVNEDRTISLLASLRP
jgi:hypothetical protein